MDLDQAQGPGVGPWLIDTLKNWGLKTLTDVQTRALSAGIAEGQSMIVAAPTSSGKTLIGEVAVLSALREGRRAVYLVSHKALADQKYADFDARFGDGAQTPIASVGLNTGDRSEGPQDARLMVATYEKALGLLLAGQLNPSDALIVADEMQILGEPGRGAEIETLCALIRHRGFKQFVALTATVENSEDFAGWMKCVLVKSSKRDVPLHQEIWFGNRVYRMTFGQDEGEEIKPTFQGPLGISQVVSQLLRDGRGPVLVFTESRREATDYAAAFGQNRPRVGHGIAIADQLDLFSEPTESSDRLKENAERAVAFHTADLSPQERQVLEEGFSNSKFDVCFATSTLAAGVNFPFKSVVFPKLTFQWGARAGSLLPRSDFRNMSGRAGRLGLHPEGFAILLPRQKAELDHSNELIKPTNEIISSQLPGSSVRKLVLVLISSGVASTLAELMAFFENTFYWYQTLNKNPKLLSDLEGKTKKAIEWLSDNKLIAESGGAFAVTPLGHGAASSGLLPSTAVQIASLLKNNIADLNRNFEACVPGLIYAICASEEFRGDNATRFLPYAQVAYDSITFWRGQKLPVPFEDADLRLAQGAHAVVMFIEGVGDRKIAFMTKISSGGVHRLANEVAWVLDGAQKIACVPEIGCSQNISNQLSMLARRVRWGAPVEALDVMRVAARHQVPGLGRQRAMALVAQGISTLHDVLSTAKDKLVQLLRNDRRAQALIDAAASTVGFGGSRLVTTHIRVAQKMGIEKLVEACERELGTEYEKQIFSLLSVESSWVITVIDDGKRQNVPDLLIQLGKKEILVECKTCTKMPPLIKKEDAWAILQKASDFDPKMHRVTLGKPTFDETCKQKVVASSDITLVEHDVFVEGLLRVHSGSLTPGDFLEWLSAPGLAEIDRLGGLPTFKM
jgi:helicase